MTSIPILNAGEFEDEDVNQLPGLVDEDAEALVDDDDDEDLKEGITVDELVRRKKIDEAIDEDDDDYDDDEDEDEDDDENEDGTPKYPETHYLL